MTVLLIIFGVLVIPIALAVGIGAGFIFLAALVQWVKKLGWIES
jgi:hypothetical protein